MELLDTTQSLGFLPCLKSRKAFANPKPPQHVNAKRSVMTPKHYRTTLKLCTPTHLVNLMALPQHVRPVRRLTPRPKRACDSKSKRLASQESSDLKFVVGALAPCVCSSRFSDLKFVVGALAPKFVIALAT
jgi:hypothetical protein